MDDPYYQVVILNPQYSILKTHFELQLEHSVDFKMIQGKIGAANVLSDLYSMGITDCDTMLMLLASSNQMNETERNIISRKFILGFNGMCFCFVFSIPFRFLRPCLNFFHFTDLAKEANTKVTGGQTVVCCVYSA